MKFESIRFMSAHNDGQILKQVQDDVTGGCEHSLFKKAFTLAEVLIVIGIIGVVAALTLPNLNHATGDKETVTRLQKAYSILNEANDRAVAIYGPVSTWKSNEQCSGDFSSCLMHRIGEFIKISKSCDESETASTNVSCSSYRYGDMSVDYVAYQMPDGTTLSNINGFEDCDATFGNSGALFYVGDMCGQLNLDINGPNKGQNKYGQDIFLFMVSDSKGIIPQMEGWETVEEAVEPCMRIKSEVCTWWVLEYGNLDYLKADNTGKCNDSNIILNGTTNTSCH